MGSKKNTGRLKLSKRFGLDVTLDSAYQGKSNCYEYDF